MCVCGWVGGWVGGWVVVGWVGGWLGGWLGGWVCARVRACVREVCGMCVVSEKNKCERYRLRGHFVGKIPKGAGNGQITK